MSSLNHPTFDIEDAFSSNSPNYTPASPNYSPASLRNTPSESSNNSYGLVPIASPTLLLFHDDPYMKVMHAYDAIIPPQVPIPPPIIVPPSPMLSPVLNPQEFFVPEELLPPKEQVSYLTSSSTDLSNPSWKQACTFVPPSFLVYTPTPPHIFKIGKSSIKMHLKHHEKQIKDILNYLEELSFYRIEKMEERLVNGWMIIQRDFDELKTELKKILILCCLVNVDRMVPKRTSTSAAPTMNQAVTRQLIDDHVAAALKAQAANMANADNTNRNLNQEKIEEVYKLSCVEFKKLLIKKYYPRTEVQKMEDEFYHLIVKGNDLNTYVRRFQELETLCPNMMPNTEKLLKVFIGGLPRSIEGNVTASKPQTWRKPLTYPRD
uniref:Reverse transcriptase domain-containing protein n=1 Tax=Tanacetum cinerariifolium TaxID=118510 RepID=A0A6L2M3Q1_TANCI|nr:reverse transcriptase domain-containing protein [Tanacetum cinerariifolium]